MSKPEKEEKSKSMVWVRDKDGKEYACYVDNIKTKEELTEEEKTKCIDVSELVGTELW